ncbi:selenium-binding family protein [Calidifontimicrobium sp. SYSU G02091]|nr:selenium-binding family protein [Calidifontimicrobium sp. SYSU G02091]
MLALAAALATTTVHADETCNSPYTSKLIKGQEEYLHVWTLGVQGLGDGSDKLVTIDVRPGSKTYGQVVHTLSVGGRGEAHHMGFTDDRRYLWAGRLDDNKIFVFDVGTDPAKPKLVRTIADFAQKTGYVGPHTFYALPGRMLIQGLSNTKDHGGVTGMALYNNQGGLVEKYDMPRGELAIGKGDGYGYDIGINPQKNVLLTSSFTGWTNYMMDMGKLVADAEAMKRFGNTMVVWDLKSMKPQKVLDVPGSPLEIRWSLNPGDNWAVTATALTSKLWLIKQDASGQWQAKEVATIGDPSKIPLPVDISITADGKGLWVNTFMDGKTRYFDLSNPEAPRQTYEKVTGKQVNMVSQSWDGKRVYITSSLLANWDKKGADDEQFLRAFAWDGKELKPQFEIDFYKLKLGRAHHMKFSAKSAPATAAADASTRLAAVRR